MIKIIKTGTRTETECSKCGCVFSYEAEDVMSENKDNPYIVRKHVICPQCGKPVFTKSTREGLNE